MFALCMGLFKPFKSVTNIYALTAEYLKEIGASYLLVDLDNTLLPWDSTELEQESMDWINAMSQSGLKICVITNSQKERAQLVMQTHNVPIIWSAMKPFPFGFLRAQKRLGATKEHSLVIGDQIFTDVFGANLVGFRSILVEPFSSSEWWWTRFVRMIERIFTKRKMK